MPEKYYHNNKCLKCDCLLIAVGRRRINGKNHDDWPSRKYHKQCYAIIKAERSREVSRLAKIQWLKSIQIESEKRKIQDKINKQKKLQDINKPKYKKKYLLTNKEFKPFNCDSDVKEQLKYNAKDVKYLNQYYEKFTK